MSGKRKGGFRLRQKLRKVIEKSLPRKVRHAMLRRFISLDYNPSPRLTVRLATSQSDLEAAFGLLHDAYVSSKFMDPHPSGLRVTKYHALPATSTIVALWDNEVVGTVSLVRRSAFGMPLETIFDITHLTQDGSRVFETSSLAVHKKFSGQHGMILFPMLKFMLLYGMRYFGSSYMTIAVNPTWIEFYDALYDFTRLSATTVDNYSFVRGAPAVGAYINLHKIEEQLKNLYKGAPRERNFHEYFFKHDMPNLQFPDRSFTKISDPILTPDLLDHFFNKRTDAFAKMSEQEVFVLHQLYRDDKFRQVLPEPPKQSNVYVLREDARIEVNLPGNIILGEAAIPVMLTDLSNGGVGILTNRPLRDGQVYNLKVHVDGQEHVLRTMLRWSSNDRLKCGLKVVESPQTWKSFTGLLRNDLLRRTG